MEGIEAIDDLAHQEPHLIVVDMRGLQPGNPPAICIEDDDIGIVAGAGDRQRPACKSSAPGRTYRPGRRDARRDRDARQRQALRRDVGAAPLHPRVVPLLRRARGQDRGRRAADRQGGDVRLHQARAPRRRGRDHAVELPPDAPLLEARPGARRGQHRRHQALRVHVLLDARAHGAGERGGLP